MIRYLANFNILLLKLIIKFKIRKSADIIRKSDDIFKYLKRSITLSIF